MKLEYLAEELGKGINRMKTLDSKPLLIHAETGLLFTFDEGMNSDSDVDVLYWVLTEELGFVPQVRGGI